MAAAMRSALARLSGRGCITAPPRIPPVRNVEGLQCCSNDSFGMADKKKLLLMKGNSEMFMSTGSKRSRETLKTVLEADHYLYGLTISGLAICSFHVMTEFSRREIPSGPRTRVPDVNYDDCWDDGKDED